MKRALVIGANGTLGVSISEQLRETHEVITLSRADTDYTEESLTQQVHRLKQIGEFERIVCTIGVLHNDTVYPEKKLSDISRERLAEYFHINTILPSLCIKHFSKLLPKKEPSVFILLSAMVGSIEDNKLGGWYGYRASKAALNMMIKTASIELQRTHKQTCIAAIHPGTTQSDLSKPFARKLPEGKYFKPEVSAARILDVANKLTSEHSGGFYHWDGSPLTW